MSPRDTSSGTSLHMTECLVDAVTAGSAPARMPGAVAEERESLVSRVVGRSGSIRDGPTAMPSAVAKEPPAEEMNGSSAPLLVLVRDEAEEGREAAAAWH